MFWFCLIFVLKLLEFSFIDTDTVDGILGDNNKKGTKIIKIVWGNS